MSRMPSPTDRRLSTTSGTAGLRSVKSGRTYSVCQSSDFAAPETDISVISHPSPARDERSTAVDSSSPSSNVAYCRPSDRLVDRKLVRAIGLTFVVNFLNIVEAVTGPELALL